MTDRALEILRMNESDYRALSAKCRQIAEQFRWEQIATDTIRQYVPSTFFTNFRNFIVLGRRASPDLKRRS